MLRKLILTVAILGTSISCFANSLTVRDIELKGDGAVQIQLDGVAPKSSLEIDYVRDIVQFSIQNATIYPAKILHADSSEAFNKVFAYQYAPNLVRVRFSVDGKADDFRGKVKWEQRGKTLFLTFPKGIIAKKEDTDTHEKSLLAKVLGHSGTKVEKIENEAKAEKVEPVKAEARAAAPSIADEAPAEAPKAEAKTHNKLTGNNMTMSAPLGGARPGPSAFRSFMAMFLVVGGLGLVLLYVKKKKNSAQANRVGDSWLSNLLPGSMKKSKALIEVIANHSLGPKQSITVVRIRGQQFVLGVTQDSVQLITQLDADEAEVDVLDDPKIADSIGKMFGSKPQVIPTQAQAKAKAAPVAINPAASRQTVDLGASFQAMLKNSNGAGAQVARHAYQAQAVETTPSQPRVSSQTVGIVSQSSVRNQIKQRLQGMKNV